MPKRVSGSARTTRDGERAMYASRIAYGSRISLFWIAYLVVGIVVAADRNYLEGIGNIEQVVEAALAVVLWPLVLLDVSMRI